MAAFHAHGPLVAFLHDLDTNTAAGATKEFLAALGRKLVVAQLIPEEEFARTGAPSAADLGCLMNRLHTMGPIINWAVEPTVHPDLITFFATSGAGLMETIKQRVMAEASAPGSGAHHPEIMSGKCLNYKEVQQVVSSGELAIWITHIANQNMPAAQAMMCTGTVFASLMRRASMFAEEGTARAVAKQEPARTTLNNALRPYLALVGEQIRAAILICLPGESALLAPAIDTAHKSMLGFATATAEESVTMMIKAAGMLQPDQKPGDVFFWGPAKVQLGLRTILIMLEHVVGPTVGGGCPDRTASMIQTWAIHDDRFAKWAKVFSTPKDISPAWHFTKLIILTPISSWLGKIWQHWNGPSAHPGTLADCLKEGNLLTLPHHNLMSQEVAKMRLVNAAVPDDSSEEEVGPAPSQPKQSSPAAKGSKPAQTAKGKSPGGKKSGGKPGGQQGGKPAGWQTETSKDSYFR